MPLGGIASFHIFSSIPLLSYIFYDSDGQCRLSGENATPDSRTIHGQFRLPKEGCASGGQLSRKSRAGLPEKQESAPIPPWMDHRNTEFAPGSIPAAPAASIFLFP